MKLRSVLAGLCAFSMLVGCGAGVDTSADTVGNNQQLQVSQDALRLGRVDFGQVGSFFGHTAFSFAIYGKHNSVQLVGISVSAKSFEDAPPPSGAPAEVDGVDLLFPQHVRDTTIFNHFEGDWEPGGHPPVYFKPHFDLHFYHQSAADVATIDCSDFSYPAPDEFAPGYVMPPDNSSCDPNMGEHALPVTDLAPGADFVRTLIWGYYHGNVIFVEPMVTQDSLLARQSFDMDVPVMANLGNQPGTLVPTHFSAHYIRLLDTYEFTFTNFVAIP